MPAPEREYYHRLQSFRGAGVLMVAFYHCQAVLGSELPLHAVPAQGIGAAQIVGHYLALALFNGHAALITFFVLSGFVLTLSLRRGPQGSAAAGATFVVARLCRIVPNNAIAILVAVAIAAAAGAAPQARVQPPWSWPQIAANMLLLDTTINPVTWSLAVELLAVPAILVLYAVARRFGSRWLVLALVAAVALSFAPGLAGYRPLGRNLFAVVLGMVVAERGAGLASRLTRQAASRWFLVALALWCLPRGLLGRWSHWPSLIEAGAAAIMIALLAFGPRLQRYRYFELRPILWLAEISYSLFLYHALLLPWTAPILFAQPHGWQPLTAVVAAWLVTTAIAIPVAWLSYAAVERPGIRLGRMLTGRLRSAGGAAFGTVAVERGTRRSTTE